MIELKKGSNMRKATVPDEGGPGIRAGVALPTSERARGINPQEDAQEAWSLMNANQRTGVRFGMFDIEVLRAFGYPAASRAFTLALMDCASRAGGMRA